MLLLAICCAAAAFGDDLVPQQVTTFMEDVQAAFQGKIVTIALGICFIGVGIGLAWTKDSAKMKAGTVAVIIGAAVVIGGPTIVDKVVSSMNS